MFPGPKGYIEQMCEVHLQYGNSTTKWPFYSFFRVNSTLFVIYSLCCLDDFLEAEFTALIVIFDKSL